MTPLRDGLWFCKTLPLPSIIVFLITPSEKVDVWMWVTRMQVPFVAYQKIPKALACAQNPFQQGASNKLQWVQPNQMRTFNGL